MAQFNNLGPQLHQRSFDHCFYLEFTFSSTGQSRSLSACCTSRSFFLSVKSFLLFSFGPIPKMLFIILPSVFFSFLSFSPSFQSLLSTFSQPRWLLLAIAHNTLPFWLLSPAMPSNIFSSLFLVFTLFQHCSLCLPSTDPSHIPVYKVYVTIKHSWIGRTDGYQKLGHKTSHL